MVASLVKENRDYKHPSPWLYAEAEAEAEAHCPTESPWARDPEKDTGPEFKWDLLLFAVS